MRISLIAHNINTNTALYVRQNLISPLNVSLHVCFYNTFFLRAPLLSVSALKPEEMPEVRMETEERQNAGYEVYHQKLV